MNSKLKSEFALIATFWVCGCASPTVVQTVKPGDTGLTCAQLQNEYSDAERLRAEADAEKSLTGGNVARAIFFWPAILGTAANANEAIAAADSRKVNLANLMNQKGCAIPVSSPVAAPAPATAQPVAATTQSVNGGQQSTEAQLTELKRLHDSNLISKEVYEERQRAILNGK